ncbi:MAG TPA: response regulator [Vicinamibacterales bacterium]|nr:response regulator [Vicinamibacterales bacterium]
MTTAVSSVCPYCGRSLRWMPTRWLGRGVFQCDQCGDFPDYRRNGAGPTSVGGPRLRVLVVDDSVEHRDFYAMLLSETMSVTTAPDGGNGIAIAKDQIPDIILLDVMMPVLDGWHVCEQLKADPATAEIPIVMLTSLDAADVPARAQQAGALAVLMKPCPLERLTLTIESAVRQA